MPDIGLIGSDGTAVAAAMESAGHWAQSLMLNEFDGRLGTHLGGLLYLIGIIGALITIASGGSYRFGLYLLVGPPLFFFLVRDQNRIASSGAEWKFGDTVLPQSEVTKGTEGLVAGDGSAGRVSIFFYAWNQVVSGAVQGAVNLLHITDKGGHRDFMMKGDRYLQVFNTGTLDPRLRGFVQIGIINKCAQWMSLQRIAADPDQPQEARDNANAALSNHAGSTVQLNFDDFPEVRDWFRLVMQGTPAASEPKFTCRSLWTSAVEAFKRIQGPNLIDQFVRAGIPPGLTEKQVRDRLLYKFGTTTGPTNTIRDLAGANGQLPDDVLLNYLVNEMAARLLLNELSQVNPNIAAMTVSHDSQLIEEGGRRMDEDTSRMIRILSRGEEYQPKGEVIIAALTLPYLQGTVLYFLAAAFPFFAISLVLPGRHTAFLLWMGLWLWAKMWDLGMAVVMMIDNVLYALLPHGPPVTDEIVNDPGRALAAVLEVDPSYSIHMYYNLLSSCMLAVPVVTGFLVHKGGNEVIDAVTATFREFPAKFGNSMAAYGRATQAQQYLSMQRKAEYNSVRAGLLMPNASDPIQAQALRGRAMAQILTQGVGIAKPFIDTTGKSIGVNKGLAGAFFNLATDAPVQGLEAMREHYSNLADASMSRNLEFFQYNASKSTPVWRMNSRTGQPEQVMNDFSYEMAANAVALRYNSHDWRQNVPIGAMIDTYNAGRYLPLRKMTDSLFEAFFSRATGQTK